MATFTRLGDTNTVKKFAIGHLFTANEVQRAVAIINSTQNGKRHARLTKEICEPAIERINKATGQENLPEYLAYALEYACGAAALR